MARVEVVGPLEPFQRTFEDALARWGYTSLSAVNQLRLMKHLSIWLEERDLDGSDLTESVASVYLSARRESGYTVGCRPRRCHRCCAACADSASLRHP